jgi:hypothetical protein
LFRDFISLSFASICFFKRTANLSNRLRFCRWIRHWEQLLESSSGMMWGGYIASILEKNTNRHDCISIEVVKAICWWKQNEI